jgi:micrococcal nuclease
MRESPRSKLRALVRYKNSRAAFILCIVGAFLAGIVVGCALDGRENPAVFEEALVAEVVDGDTVQLLDGRTVRYLGIDTPEAGEAYFAEATARNRELVEGKVVELQAGRDDTDKYGRLLRYVYSDGVFVNAELVAQGYAKAYIFDPHGRYSQVLVQMEQYAKMGKRGVWSATESGEA